jgi:hypothetical protein
VSTAPAGSGIQPRLPIAADLDARHRTAPAMPPVIGDQRVAQRFGGETLEMRIEAGAHGKTRGVEALFAVALQQFAADFLGEIVGFDDLGIVAAAQRDRLRLGRGALLLGEVARLDHAIEHVVAALARGFGIALWIVVVRRFRQTAEERGFLRRQLVQRFVEIIERRCRDTVRATAEVDLIEIKLEDAILAERLLHANRDQGFAHFALKRDLVGQQEVLRHLLGDRRGADRPPAAAVMQRIGHCRAQHREGIDAGMGIEILVLGREKSVNHQRRHRFDRDEDALLGRVFGHQAAIAGIDPRHHRRLIIGQLLVIRQVAAEIPNREPGRPSTRQAGKNYQRYQYLKKFHPIAPTTRPAALAA